MENTGKSEITKIKEQLLLLNKKQNQIIKKINKINARQQELEVNAREKELPKTMILSPSFVRRSFAILGHSLFANLLLTIPFMIIGTIVMLFILFIFQ